MKRLLLALLLCVPAAVCGAEYRCDADGGVMYTADRVVDLPQDQDRWYCSILGNPVDSQFQQVRRWFDENPELQRIKDGTHFSEIESTSAMYRSRYDKTTGDLPCVRIQDESGNVVYQVSGKNIPLTSEALCNSIRSNCWRRNHRPGPQPTPQPAAPTTPGMNLHYHFSMPEAKKPDQEQPDIFAKQEATLGPLWFWVLTGAGVVSVVAGVAYEWRKSYEA